jgi:hypothetical protein
VTAFIAKFAAGWIHIAALRAGKFYLAAALVAKFSSGGVLKLTFLAFHGCPPGRAQS